MDDFNLGMDAILDGDELDFDTPPVEETDDKGEKKEEKKEEKVDNTEFELTTEELTADELEEPLESVGGEKSEKKTGGTNKVDAEGSSPTYSSIASAFKVDGVPLFSDEDDEELAKLEDASSFEDFVTRKINQAVEERLDEEQKRIKNALTYGMEPSDIQVYESSLKNLKAINEEDIKDESEEGENLRKKLIKSNLINRGFSEERADAKVQKSFTDGTDVEDATDAWIECKKFYQEKYDAEFNARKAEYDKFIEKRNKDAETLKNSILDESNDFAGIKVDKVTRQKVYDAINRPAGKDANGKAISALMKYADENPVDFRKYTAYFYVITDGFKNLDKVKDLVGKEVRKKEISALERTLNSTVKSTGGNMRHVGGNGNDWGSNEASWQIEL